MCFDVGFTTCGPNEVLLISGLFYVTDRGPTIIQAGRAIVMPCLHTIQRLPLSTMTLILQTPNVYTKQGIPISVTGVAQVKISSQNEDMLHLAAMIFADKSVDEIKHSKYSILPFFEKGEKRKKHGRRILKIVLYF